jgi:glutathione S-transferase
MKLYDMKFAPNPRRVRMFLAEKGVEIERIEIDIQAGDNLKPDYLAINPRGVVPTLLLDDGRILDESVAICRYIEGLHPEPNLFGRDPFEQAEVERWGRRSEFDGMFNLAAAFRNTHPAFAGRSVPGSGPETPQIPALAERGRRLARHWMEALDRHLEGRNWLALDRFTIADITTLACLDFAKWVDLKPGPDLPSLAAYHARRPGPR